MSIEEALNKVAVPYITDVAMQNAISVAKGREAELTKKIETGAIYGILPYGLGGLAAIALATTLAILAVK